MRNASSLTARISSCVSFALSVHALRLATELLCPWWCSGRATGTLTRASCAPAASTKHTTVRTTTLEQALRTVRRALEHAACNATFVYRSFSPRHFAGGDWKSGGQCRHGTNVSQLEVPKAPSAEFTSTLGALNAAHRAWRGTRLRAFSLLDVTTMSLPREDAHPGRLAASSAGRYDCSHWCLPGLPDVWNHLLAATLGIEGLLHALPPSNGSQESLVHGNW